EYTCDGKNEIDIPLVVLINGNSASASEILAGAVKDYGIGTIVGTTTYGKGVVQNIFGLSDGSAVKLTISNYFTPNGNNIHGIGIVPDVEVELDADKYYDEDVDTQIEKALEILNEKIK
ncbi:MAG: S41 family peptidase, partial [Lachnospiraceae bacterium]|nr:S41 family peptidase [Lachnospiraceae bacterium]